MLHITLTLVLGGTKYILLDSLNVILELTENLYGWCTSFFRWGNIYSEEKATKPGIPGSPFGWNML